MASNSATATPSRSKTYLEMLKQTASSWVEDNCPRLAAALAFYTFLSLAPLLVISIKILAVFLSKESASSTVQKQIGDLVGEKGASAIAEMTANAGHSGAGILATIISFVILAVSATGVFVELQGSMDIIWEVQPKPHQGIWGFIRTRLLTLAMVFAIGFILLVSFCVSTVVSSVVKVIALKYPF